ncbi:MAG: hypothetical protein WCT10_04970 [Patescibacteria group bacterium]
MTAAAAVGLFIPWTAWVGIPLALAYFLFHGWLAGNRLFPSETGGWQAYWGTASFVAAGVILGSLTYFFFSLDRVFLAAILALLAGGVNLLSQRAPELDRLIAPPETTDTATRIRPWLKLAAAAVVALEVSLLLYGFRLLAIAATDGATRSPWDHVPRMFFVLFFIAALGLFAITWSGLAARIALAGSGVLALLMAGVSAIVYKVGFGFDPFIHQAAEKTIWLAGAIAPKTPYYLGQYFFVVLLAHLTKLGVAAIDVWLVPAVWTLIGFGAFWGLKKACGWPARLAAPAALVILLLPLSSFTMTTPQGLADALVLLAAFASLPIATGRSGANWLPLLLAAAATAIHPLAGLPLLAFAALVFLASLGDRIWKKYRWPLGAASAVIIILGAIALPAAFLINARLSGAAAALNETALRAPAAIIENLEEPALLTRQFMAVFDFAYFWRAIRWTALLTAAGLGFWLLFRRHRRTAAYAGGALIVAVNYLILKTAVIFPFLIAYERSSYADRLLDLLLFLAAPLAAYAFGRTLDAIDRRGFPLMRVTLAVLMAAFLTSSLYLAYPRRDKYESSRGWSTSGSDVKTVRAIEADAAGEPYIVLANQSVAAAAIREFGFKKYFTSQDAERPGEIFFYPIPTGGPLYAEFLKMNDARGSAAAAKKAMDLAGTDLAYFVVTDYWWQAQKIILAAERQADQYWSIDEHDHIFKYVRD